MFCHEIDFNNQSAAQTYFNPFSRSKVFIEKFQGESYLHTLKKKIDDKFCKIDKLVGSSGGFKMESRFKTEVKDLVCDIWIISRKKPWYIKSIRKDSERSSAMDNSDLETMLKNGSLSEKQVQLIRKEKEVESNRLEKQEALLDSARISVMNSTLHSRISKSICSGTYDEAKFTEEKALEDGNSPSETISELDSKELNNFCKGQVCKSKDSKDSLTSSNNQD